MHIKYLSAVFAIILLLGVLPAFAQDDEPAATEEAMPAATEEAMPAATEEAEADEEEDEPATTVTISGEACPPDLTDSIEYRIQPRDTLFSIARRYNISAFCLADYNDIDNPSLIFWGSVIDIPVAGDDGGTGGPTEPGEDGLTTYTVRQGDNLYRVSLRFDTTIARLQDLNPSITNPNVIFIGQELIVPETS